MVTLDYILLGIILIIALLGFKKGFLESLGSIIGLILAAVVASRYYLLVGAWFGGSNLAHIIAFILIFGVSIKIISLLFWAFGKIFQIITVLPFIASFDRLLGLILGFAEGIFILSIVLFFMLKYPLSDWVMDQMAASVVAKTLLKIALMFIPLFPQALKSIKSFM
ncbi:MAG: CvpA family protein [Parcubacteria group bacterium]